MVQIRRPRPTGVKANAPETIEQARRWQIRRDQYAAAGFCDRCAAQAAWGHQLGFAEQPPPCERCTGLSAPVVGREVGPRALVWIGTPTASTRPTLRVPLGSPDPRASCSGCSARWAGLAPAHCTACHETFGGVTGFDRHRRAGNGRGRCLHPTEVVGKDGQALLVLRDGVWRNPEQRPMVAR